MGGRLGHSPSIFVCPANPKPLAAWYDPASSVRAEKTTWSLFLVSAKNADRFWSAVMSKSDPVMEGEL
tara:strand:- start:468 stop:671 length:204 start_codon:yes stop_codon:yes gene_type:complete